MGDFYKKPEAKQEKVDEDSIKSVHDLKVAFEIEEKRTQDTIDNLGEATIPYRVQLEGDKQTKGDIEWMKEYLQDKRMHKMTIAQKLVSMMDSITMLMGWDLRYIEFLHTHIGNYKQICKSALRLVEEKEKEILELKDPTMAEETLPKEEIDRFKEMFIERVNEYLRLLRINDPNAQLAIGRAFLLCHKSRQKRQIADSLFEYMIANSGIVRVEQSEAQKNPKPPKKILPPTPPEPDQSQSYNESEPL